MDHCELCQLNPSTILWQNDHFSVIKVDDELYPGYIRIISREHKPEMTDLNPQTRAVMWKIMDIVEITMRKSMSPHKVNWAQFGNMVPHLHWHAIPRYTDDAHFPQSIWGIQQRQCRSELLMQRQLLAKQFHQELAETLAREFLN